MVLNGPNLRSTTFLTSSHFQATPDEGLLDNTLKKATVWLEIEEEVVLGIFNDATSPAPYFSSPWQAKNAFFYFETESLGILLDLCIVNNQLKGFPPLRGYSRVTERRTGATIVDAP